MKQPLFCIALLLISSPLFAQTEHGAVVKVETRTLTSAEVKALYSTKITDPKFYDLKGNVIDSAEAVAKLRTLDYQQGWTTIAGDRKKLITKVDSASQMQLYASLKASFAPKSDKLKDGTILDLKPFGKRIDRDKLENKAVLLIFWCDGCYNGKLNDDYAAVNSVLSNYVNPEKLAVITITHHGLEQAAKALARNPIINTQHIIDAGELTDAYETGNRPVLVLADKNHKILYSVANAPVMTPWMLNKRLKEIMK
jgi:hypothetical protein